MSLDVAAQSQRGFRLGIDVGGTFTDAVLIDEDTGALTIDKVSTTPADLSEGVDASFERLKDRARFQPDELRYLIHASTVASNALLQRTGARAGLLVTAGFRDILEIARQIRYELYNLQTEKPRPLIPRELCVEVPERLDHRGEVLVPLDEQALVRAVETLRAEKLDSIAVCFLHSYRNPAHEQRAGEIIEQICPGLPVSISSEIAPEIREYWRASTAVTNAYVAPAVSSYLDAIEQKMSARGVTTGLHIMQSSGGVMTVASAKKRPVTMLESGPAAGVIAAAFFAELTGFGDAISFDMGGTTAKVGLILDGKPRVVSEFEAGGVAGSGSGIAKGSGYPILVPVMDLVEVGAGGGSIAWIDAGGLMRVGPKSAGADPGPACYGKGGREPTVTDANLTLGRLNADYFLGGEISLHRKLARDAIAARCADALCRPVESTAMGIVEIANSTMVEAMRLVSVQRGYDPREFSLVTFGGAGPVHANRLAAELGIPVIVVPPSPGVASAMGMLISDLRHDYRITRLTDLGPTSFDALNEIYEDFESKAFGDLSNEGVDRENVTLEHYLDMRYVGQSWTLRIPTPSERLTEDGLAKLESTFHDSHHQSYGYSVPGEPLEIVNVGLLAVGRAPKPRLENVPEGDGSSAHALKGERPVYFEEAAAFVDCPIYDRYRLQQHDVVAGPAVIEEIDSTTLLHPGYQAKVGIYGVLLLKKKE
jgi:N-methylhydantoinase A